MGARGKGPLYESFVETRFEMINQGRLDETDAIRGIDANRLPYSAHHLLYVMILRQSGITGPRHLHAIRRQGRKEDYPQLQMRMLLQELQEPAPPFLVPDEPIDRRAVEILTGAFADIDDFEVQTGENVRLIRGKPGALMIDKM